MGKNKNEYIKMKQQEQDGQTTQFTELSFPKTMTKKDAKSRGEEAAKNIIRSNGFSQEASGFHKALANASRLKEVAGAFEETLRNEVLERQKEKKHEEYGVEFSIVSSGETIDYGQDPVYKQLAEKLKKRKEILKTAKGTNGRVFDSDGSEVPKVDIKNPSKETIKLKY